MNRIFDFDFFFFKPIDEIDDLIGSTAVPQQIPRKRSQLEQALSPGLNPMKKKRTRLYSFFIYLCIRFHLALVLKNYVYRRHSSNGGSSGPPSPATSTTSTDDGMRHR
jgi:hypothetical protein